MFENKHILRQLAGLFLVTIVGGTIGYTVVEDGWTYFDGFYMTIITLTTIGFGEVHEMSTGGRVLTVLIIVFGLGSAATILTQVAQLFLQGNISAVWRKHRMDKKIAKMQDHVIICGFGRIGQAICQDLTNMGVQCVIVERDKKRVDNALELGIIALEGNGTTDHGLLTAGIDRASVLVAALSNDSDNLFVALAARDLNAGLTVIARGEDKSIETRMLRAGVDQVVYPAQLGGGQIARLIGADLGKDESYNHNSRATDIMGYDLQVYRNFSSEGTTVQAILEKTGALQAVAFMDNDGHRHPAPGPEQKVMENEAVVLLNELVSSQDTHGVEEGLAELPKNLLVGIPSVDEEHQIILGMVKKLQSTALDGKKQVVKEVLQDLRGYTLKHFKHEEALLVSADYPDIDAHVREHAKLAQRVDALIADREKVSPESLAELLNTWIRHHILVSDRKYVEHMNKINGVTADNNKEKVPCG